MIILKNLTVKNFMSIGNQTQAVDFQKEQLTLVLGENLDMGGDDNGSRNGTGKAQPLTSNILTPNGWKKMKDIAIGDKVITANGVLTSVNGIFPQGIMPTYKLTFKDGRTCEATNDHLWQVYSHLFNLKSDKDKTRIVTTDELIKLLARKDTRPNSGSSSHVYIPLITPLNIKDIKLPVDPWLLGFLIGDGSFTKSSAGFGFTSADDYLIKKANYISNRDFNCYVKTSRKISCSFIMENRKKFHPMREAFNDLGLIGHLSYTKFIPQIYKSASINQKLSLLQGLIDSDGTVDSRTGSITFTSVSEQLANDVAYIVRSIGGIAKISTKRNKTYTYKNEKVKCADSFTVSIRYKNMKDLASLPRKKDLVKENYQYADKLRLQIVSIEQIKDQECQCISIDDPSHLYVTDNFVVTHNTTIVNALSYALFGVALTNIKKDNLINKINNKNMLVTLTFSKDNTEYRIERGRRPGILKFYVNNQEQETDDAQGDNRETQKDLGELLGMSHNMFKHIVALNTYTEPFLSMRAADQRDIIEQLLGVTLLSEKAELLKNLIKTTKDIIFQETANIEAAKLSNEKIQTSINSLILKQTVWNTQKGTDLNKISKAIIELESIDIAQEIDQHNKIKVYDSVTSQLESFNKEKSTLELALIQAEKSLIKYQKELDQLKNKKCHACEQDLHDHKHQEMTDLANQNLNEANKYVKKVSDDLKKITKSIADIGELGPRPDTFYETEAEALQHQTNLSVLESQLVSKSDETDPYQEQIDELLNTAIQEISWNQVNELTTLKEHQEFLLKLLVNKDSFIRKKIIDQNLSYLNNRLTYYLDKMGLPHTVVFQNDLTVEITQLGQDLDFFNLSRGEMTRLTLGLSFAFRDIFEHLFHHINLIFIDELIDNGLDAIGVENSLGMMKKIARDRNKNIFLISHKDELIGRVNNVLKVVKEGGFTSYEFPEYIE